MYAFNSSKFIKVGRGVEGEGLRERGRRRGVGRGAGEGQERDEAR